MIQHVAKPAFAFLAVLFLNHDASAQPTNYVGLNFTVESTSDEFRPGIGIVYDRQMTRHSGLQTGVFYRNYAQDGYVTYTDGWGTHYIPFTVSERHLSVPVLYKFYSRIVDIAAGPTFDFYMGWKQRGKTGDLEVDSYNIDPAFAMGLLAKISKRIRLSEGFTLEPEVRANPLFTNNRYYVGFGIAGKYRL